jgi:ABC-2 type transport system permease protein/sodium transport system permease protein
LFLLGKYLGLGGFDFEQQEFVQQIVDRWQMANPVVILISFALIPALCEEWFFRGYLFSALLKTTGALGAILLSALLFGAFHVVSSSALTTERFITTTLLGLVLGVVAWRTGSVLPGIVMHVVHNGILISIAIFANQLAARGWGVEPDSHLPVAWIVAAVIVTAAGAAVLFTSGPAVGEQALETESRESLGLPHDELKVTSG